MVSPFSKLNIQMHIRGELSSLDLSAGPTFEHRLTIWRPKLRESVRQHIHSDRANITDPLRLVQLDP